MEARVQGKPAPTSKTAATPGREQGPIRVVIVDDHLMIAELMRLRLEQLGGMQVLGVATEGTAALELIRQHRPDVLLLDLTLPGVNGVEIARRVLRAFPAVAVLVLTGYYRLWDPRPLLQMGVRGYLPKTIGIDELVAAIRAVAQGRTVLVSEPPRAAIEDPVERLTDREREALRLLAAGLHNREIAAAMGVSRRTAELHVSHILAKLGARSRTEALLKAQHQGLVPTDPPAALR